jgi:hypothetical protein
MNVEERERTALVAQEILPAEPLSLRIADAMKFTGIPRSTLYEPIRQVPSTPSRSADRPSFSTRA